MSKALKKRIEELEIELQEKIDEEEVKYRDEVSDIASHFHCYIIEVYDVEEMCDPRSLCQELVVSYFDILAFSAMQ